MYPLQSKPDSHHEQYYRQKHAQRRCTLYHSRNKSACFKVVCHRFKRPRKSQYKYRRHHLLKSCGDRIHTFVELQHTAEHIICDYNYQRRDRAERQTVSRIAVCKCRHKIRTGEKSAGIDHTHNAEHDKHSNRKYKVYNPSTLGHRLCVLLISIVFLS